MFAHSSQTKLNPLPLHQIPPLRHRHPHHKARHPPHLATPPPGLQFRHRLHHQQLLPHQRVLLRRQLGEEKKRLEATIPVHQQLRNDRVWRDLSWI